VPFIFQLPATSGVRIALPCKKGQKTSINVAKKHKKADPRGPALKGGGRVAFRPLKINEK
jgi:hypothetical protein